MEIKVNGASLEYSREIAEQYIRENPTRPGEHEDFAGYTAGSNFSWGLFAGFRHWLRSTGFSAGDDVVYVDGEPTIKRDDIDRIPFDGKLQLSWQKARAKRLASFFSFMSKKLRMQRGERCPTAELEVKNFLNYYRIWQRRRIVEELGPAFHAEGSSLWAEHANAKHGVEMPRDHYLIPYLRKGGFEVIAWPMFMGEADPNSKEVLVYAE